jgi:hypothetical protein
MGYIIGSARLDHALSLDVCEIGSWRLACKSHVSERGRICQQARLQVGTNLGTECFNALMIHSTLDESTPKRMQGREGTDGDGIGSDEVTDQGYLNRD